MLKHTENLTLGRQLLPCCHKAFHEHAGAVDLGMTFWSGEALAITPTGNIATAPAVFATSACTFLTSRPSVCRAPLRRHLVSRAATLLKQTLCRLSTSIRATSPPPPNLSPTLPPEPVIVTQGWRTICRRRNTFIRRCIHSAAERWK